MLNSVNFCSDKITDFERKLVRLDDYVKKVEGLTLENKNLKSEVQVLGNKVNELDQISRAHNLEILNVAERDNENLRDTLKKIGAYIDYNIPIENIEYIHRVRRIYILTNILL